MTYEKAKQRLAALDEEIAEHEAALRKLKLERPELVRQKVEQAPFGRLSEKWNWNGPPPICHLRPRYEDE